MFVYAFGCQLRDKFQVSHMEGSEEGSEDESDDDFVFTSLAFSSNSFPIIPRATTISRVSASRGRAEVRPILTSCRHGYVGPVISY